MKKVVVLCRRLLVSTLNVVQLQICLWNGDWWNVCFYCFSIWSALCDAQHGPSIIFDGETFFYRFSICSLWHVTIIIGYWQPCYLLFCLWYGEKKIRFGHLFNWLLLILLAHLSNLFGDRVDLRYKLLKIMAVALRVVSQICKFDQIMIININKEEGVKTWSDSVFPAFSAIACSCD